MKYKTLGTQLKEIPVIFRSELGPEIKTPGSTNYGWLFDTTIKGISMGPFAVAEIPDTEISSTDQILLRKYLNEEPEEIRVNFDNNYYNLPAIEPGILYGEMVDEITPDFTNYPLLLSFNPTSTGVILNDTNNHSFSMRYVDVEYIITGGKATYKTELTGNGQIKSFHARFACGENGTLHLKPYVILNGNIKISLCDFAQGSNDYISGDNEEFTFDCYVPIETHALLCLDAENVGEYTSVVDAAIVVQYEDFIEPESIVGYEGINLRHR